MKMRSGEPNERLAARLGISRRSFERKLSTARRCLLNDFVPRHLGWDHISREEIISRSLVIPNSLYGENGTRAILIVDGTYIFIQKRRNHENISNKFSSLSRLLRVVAYCTRFLKKEKDKIPKHTYLLKEEIQEALDYIVKQCQNDYFKQEIQDITSG